MKDNKDIRQLPTFNELFDDLWSPIAWPFFRTAGYCNFVLGKYGY